MNAGGAERGGNVQSAVSVSGAVSAHEATSAT